MNMQPRRRSLSQNSHAPAPRGFTLVELLTVIGIIVLLVAILLPVVRSVRISASVADTASQISNISAAAQRYYADFNAYPGPLSNMQVRYTGTNNPNITSAVSGAPTPTALTGWNAAKITMSENLVLGLMGGLRRGGTATEPTFTFDTNLVGQGPLSLGSNPKKNPAYLDPINLSWRPGGANQQTGDYLDESGSGDDSLIPEIVDRLPDPMPILYLRARTGMGVPPGTQTAASNAVVTNGTRVGQYDLSQIEAYTKPNPPPTGPSIGVGRSVPAAEFKNGPPWPQHGLQTVDLAKSVKPNLPNGQPDAANYQYPYDLYALLKDPSVPNTPRQKDAFILISAGPDRVYGTSDDITNFGSIQ